MCLEIVLKLFAVYNKLLLFCLSKFNKMSLEEAKMHVDETKDSMHKAIEHLEVELLKIRAGKASPNMVDGLVVEYYGSPTPLSQVANINTLDARTLVIQPWEKSMLGPIEMSILAANLGVTPMNDGVVIRLILPPLTEERRKDLVKSAKSVAENSKVAVRNIRRDAMEAIKKLQKDGLAEDAAKGYEAEIQALTDKYIALADKHMDVKEKEIMTV
jgi:ribosome recycling factor